MTAAKLVPAEKSRKAVTNVFAGITVGFAFGVPITSYLAEKISLEAAFLFGAVVSLIAFVGILVWLPSMPVTEKMSYGCQLGILRNPQMWLHIATVIFIFAAMFSVYSYFAEYLGQVTHMDGAWISIMLMAFGIIMIFGNFFFGSLLQKSVKRTVILFPLLYAAIYMLAYFLGSYFIPMVMIVVIWGAVHSGGLIVSQTWLMTEAKEAPEFGNSLFVLFQSWNYDRNYHRRLVYFSLWNPSTHLEWNDVYASGFLIDHDKNENAQIERRYAFLQLAWLTAMMRTRSKR